MPKYRLLPPYNEYSSSVPIQVDMSVSAAESAVVVFFGKDIVDTKFDLSNHVGRVLEVVKEKRVEHVAKKATIILPELNKSVEIKVMAEKKPEPISIEMVVEKVEDKVEDKVEEKIEEKVEEKTEEKRVIVPVKRKRF